MRPLVYIIILNYKGYDTTVSCVKNLLNQNYDNFKILVVDNNSADGSYEKLCEKFPSIEVVQTGENLGYAGGNNVGIQLALNNKAKYIGILNNDIKAENNLISEMVYALEKNVKIGMLGPVICEWNSDIIQSAGARISLYTGNSILYHKGEDYVSIDEEMVTEGNYLGGAALFVRSSILDDIGFIPENYFLFYEETEWCIRAKRAGYDIACDTNTRIWHMESATVNQFSEIKSYYLNRNQILFVKRNSNFIQKIFFWNLLLLKTIYRVANKKNRLNIIALLDGIKGIDGIQKSR